MVSIKLLINGKPPSRYTENWEDKRKLAKEEEPSPAVHASELQGPATPDATHIVMEDSSEDVFDNADTTQLSADKKATPTADKVEKNSLLCDTDGNRKAVPRNRNIKPLRTHSNRPKKSASDVVKAQKARHCGDEHPISNSIKGHTCPRGPTPIKRKRKSLPYSMPSSPLVSKKAKVRWLTHAQGGPWSTHSRDPGFLWGLVTDNFL